MHKNDENPFLSLDKKSFPKKRSKGKQKEAKAPLSGKARNTKAGKAAPPPPKAAAQAAAAPMPEPVEQEELFLQAMNGVEPLDKNRGRVVAKKANTLQSSQTPPSHKDEDAEVTNKLADLVNGKVEFKLENTEEYINGHVVGLDVKLQVRLKAGFYSPEAHLDMHGFNSEQAWVALIQFIKESYMQGRRCLLLIPGRGKNSPEGYGVLRERVQLWLTQDPMKRVVLAFCTALPKHGGAGALYVLLRKQKGKGKINWDRYPVDMLPHI